ncbi:PID-CTERM protein-sorting domain-containing protein [Aridibaculum aurantiacum]|uniref:PID-CTERM protein-sorting domain-containing protein n=1 Tax=Aridibaculum aurantiacum TaxID=2810307 RepID=UPI001A9682FA|nr:hypothetical protein [Aridibaculum aurantiacum]
MRSKLLSAFFILVAFMMPVLLNAQTDIDPGGDPDAPIDGGLSLLLAAGVGYVAKKGYDARKNRNSKEVTE